MALSACLAQGSKPVLLRLRLTQGASAIYHVDAHVKTSVPFVPEPGQPPRETHNTRDTESEMVRKVVAALPAGGGEIRSTMRRQTIISDGHRQHTEMPGPTVIKYDGLGRVQELDDDSEAGQPREALRRLMGEGTAVTTIYLPEKPVKPGDTWVTPVRIHGVTDHGKVTSTLVAFGSEGGRATATIRSVIDIPIHSDFIIPKDVGRTISLTGQGSFRSQGAVDVATGTIVRLDVTGKVTVGGSVAGSDPILVTLFPKGISITGDVSMRMSRVAN